MNPTLRDWLRKNEARGMWSVKAEGTPGLLTCYHTGSGHLLITLEYHSGTGWELFAAPRGNDIQATFEAVEAMWAEPDPEPAIDVIACLKAGHEVTHYEYVGARRLVVGLTDDEKVEVDGLIQEYLYEDCKDSRFFCEECGCVPIDDDNLIEWR